MNMCMCISVNIGGCPYPSMNETTYLYILPSVHVFIHALSIFMQGKARNMFDNESQLIKFADLAFPKGEHLSPVTSFSGIYGCMHACLYACV